MVIGINAGHTLTGFGSGAVGILSESKETRAVVKELIKWLENENHKVYDCTIDKASSQNEYLAQVVTMANAKNLNYFISIHFNASNGEGKGTEVYTYKGEQFPDAVEVTKNLEKLGFQNRGVKDGSGLYVIKKTKAKSMLVEICFVDNVSDTKRYKDIGTKTIAKAIAEGIIGKVIKEPEKEDSSAVYKVQMGAFKEKKNADFLVQKLKKDGYESIVVKA